MATIKDVARLAGVSHGTVSNVMNKKGNVSVDKIRLVESVAAQLGYSLNVQAQRLRMEQPRQVCVILPDLFTEQYVELYDTLQSCLAASQYAVSLHLSGGISEPEHACLRDAAAFCPGNIIVAAPSLPMQEYAALGCQVTLVDAASSCAAQDGTADLLGTGLDVQLAAADCAKRIITIGGQRIAFFGDAAHLPLDRIFFQSLSHELEGHNKVVKGFQYSQKLISNGAFEIAASGDFDIVMTTGRARVTALLNTYRLNHQEPPVIISLTASNTVKESSFIAYETDYRQIGVQIANWLIEEAVPAGDVLFGGGFRFEFPRIRPKGCGDVISMLTISSPTSDALSKLSPSFEKQSGVKLKITTLPHDELYTTLNTIGGRHYDLIRMDMVWLTQLEQRLCMPLKSYLPALESEIKDFLPAVARLYCKPAQELYTLPLDPSIQLLFYRKDLFEDATVRRLYYERNKGELAPPAGYPEFNRVAEFFTRRYNEQSPTKYGTALTYGMSSVAASDFLPRLSDMGGSIFDVEGEFALDSPQVRAALENYLASQPYAAPTVSNWWGDTMKLFADGATAMTTIFLNHASQIISSPVTSLIGRVAAAPVPGNMPLLGGGCIGISGYSRKEELCIEFLKWVYSEEISTLLTLLGGLSPCGSPYKNEQVLALYPWLRSINDCFHTGNRHCGSARYPQFDNYRFELLLGGHLRNMMTGVVDIDQMMLTLNEECKRQFGVR